MHSWCLEDEHSVIRELIGCLRDFDLTTLLGETKGTGSELSCRVSMPSLTDNTKRNVQVALPVPALEGVAEALSFDELISDEVSDLRWNDGSESSGSDLARFWLTNGLAVV
jgi:hypothetical protein